jgi:O-antigen/teichoic acid export membrane protein
LIKNEDDLYKYVLLIISGSYFVNITLIPSLRKTQKKIKLKSLNLLPHLRPILFLFIPQVAINIYTVLDKSMIGFLTHSNIENGYYEQAIKITKLSLTIITSLGIVMAPRISNLYSSRKFEEIKERLYSSFKFVFFLGLPMLFGLIGISDIFVPVFFGPGYAKSILLLKILSGLFIAIGLNNVIGSQYLIPLKKEKIFTLSVISGAVVNFSLNLFLIQKFQSVGAAISSVTAESLITFIQFFYIRKIMQLKKLFFLTYHYIISSVIMYLVLILLKNALRVSILNLIIMIAGCSSLYFFLLILFRDNFVLTFINAILKRLKTETVIKHI